MVLCFLVYHMILKNFLMFVLFFLVFPALPAQSVYNRILALQLKSVVLSDMLRDFVHEAAFEMDDTAAGDTF